MRHTRCTQHPAPFAMHRDQHNDATALYTHACKAHTYTSTHAGTQAHTHTQGPQERSQRGMATLALRASSVKNVKSGRSSPDADMALLHKLDGFFDGLRHLDPEHDDREATPAECRRGEFIYEMQAFCARDHTRVVPVPRHSCAHVCVVSGRGWWVVGCAVRTRLASGWWLGCTLRKHRAMPPYGRGRHTTQQATASMGLAHACLFRTAADSETRCSQGGASKVGRTPYSQPFEQLLRLYCAEGVFGVQLHQLVTGFLCCTGCANSGAVVSCCEHAMPRESCS